METTLLKNSSIADQSRPSYLHYLLILALLTDVFTPFLIWKNIVPAEVRWISHAVILLVILGAFMKMAIINRFPKITWLILASSAIWVWVAIGYGQGLLPTMWGWWLMFQYPLVGLYMYLQSWRPKSFFDLLRSFCLALLTLEVIVQIIQYMTGQTPGDSLAGTFGKNGTGILVIFTLFTICLTLGEWIASRKWKPFLYALALGVISSALAELKFFAPALIGLCGLAFLVMMALQKQVLRMIPVAILLCLVVVGFIYAYDTFVPGAKNHPIENYILQPQTLVNYLSERRQVQRGPGEYYYDINRLYALSYGWDSIRQDPFTLLFGFGLGARSESSTLGTTGVSLQMGDLGKTIGTSLLVMLQELGLVGCLLLVIVFIWIAIQLVRRIKRSTDAGLSALYYALLLFTIAWPLWLFYNTAWTLRAPMLLYWASLGFALSYPLAKPVEKQLASKGIEATRALRKAP